METKENKLFTNILPYNHYLRQIRLFKPLRLNQKLAVA